jgi:hypothetical protein
MHIVNRTKKRNFLFLHIPCFSFRYFGPKRKFNDRDQTHLYHEHEQLIRITFAVVRVTCLDKSVSELCVQNSGDYV